MNETALLYGAIYLGLLLAFGGLVILACYLFPELRALIIGIGRSPRAAGLARLVVFHLGPSVIFWLNAYIAGWTDPRLIGLQGLISILMRQVEAEMDRRLKPSQNQVNPPPVAGGGGAGLIPPS